MLQDLPSGWTVESIDVFGHEFATIHIVNSNGQRTTLQTAEFGVGRRGGKAVALAKFAEACGFGNRRQIYNFIWALPEEWDGPLYPIPPIDNVTT